jgi:hypothetical protein
MGKESMSLEEMIKRVGGKAMGFNFMPLALHGKTKKHFARAEIQIPEELVGEDANDFNKYVFKVIAIPKEDFNKAFDA